jgi:hypothetical protein
VGCYRVIVWISVLCVIYCLPVRVRVNPNRSARMCSKGILLNQVAFCLVCLSNPAPIPEYKCRPYNRVMCQV